VKDFDSSLGYLTRSVDDLRWLCERTFGKSRGYNPYVIQRWDDERYNEYKNKKLKYGYMIDYNEM
jgi:hypothetical protein